MSLKEARDTLLAISHPEQVLRYADSEMDKRREQGSMYELTAKYAWLKPILEFYTEDLEGWCKFIKGVRERLTDAGRTSDAAGVQAFYEVLQVRRIQRRTRACTEPAIEQAVQKRWINNDYLSKQRYEKFCIQQWKKRKDLMLKNVRAASPTGRVSQDHREELLKEFWENVAAEVNNGEIPKP